MSCLITLSPAKRVRLYQGINPAISNYYKTQEFTKKTELLVSLLQRMTVIELEKLMSISKTVAELNYKRYNSFYDNDEMLPAIFSFYGEAYQSIEPESLTLNEMIELEEKLCILSGLYGALTPLTLIKEYRLEMGRKIQTNEHKNLYEFWRDDITNLIIDRLKKKDFLLNLASNEYGKVINYKQINKPIITPVFKDKTKNGYKIIMHYAKKARGLMVRYVIRNQVNDLSGIEKFQENGYSLKEVTQESGSNVINYIYINDKRI